MIGWALLSRDQVAKAEAALRGETDQGVLDEVGLLVLHQGFADRFFPGTSVLHTRLRYALFVPWAMEDAQGDPKRLQDHEVLITKQLARPWDKDFKRPNGIIGVETLPDAPSQPPSTSYWGAISTWGLLRPEPELTARTRGAVLKTLAARAEGQRTQHRVDGELLTSPDPSPFVGLPPRPNDWLKHGRPLDFELAPDERTLMKKHWLGLWRDQARRTPSALAQLADVSRKRLREMTLIASNPWADEVIQVVDPAEREVLKLARRAAALAAVGRAVYASLVEEELERDGHTAGLRLHRGRLAELIQTLGEDARDIDLDAVTAAIPRLPQDLVALLTATRDWLASGSSRIDRLWEVYQRAEHRRKGARALATNASRAKAARRVAAGQAPNRSTPALSVASRARPAVGSGWTMSQQREDAPKHLASVPLLDALRPPPGWHTERAVVSTYSARSAVVVATLLALARQDDEAGSGTRLDLARSFTRLRHKVHFIVQAGRLGLSNNPAPILSLLDRFLVQVPWDEGDQAQWRGRSWHPKFALARHVSADEQAARWVFILGSRNLTHDTSWDLCLSLESGEESRSPSQVIPGIDSLARGVAGLAADMSVWRDFAHELSRVQWRVPTGLRVHEVRLMLPDDPGRHLPSPPPDTRRLLAVAPFLDGECVRALAGWCVNRRLLSTRAHLAKLATQSAAPLRGWGLLELPEPEYQVHEDADTDAPASEGAVDAQNRGLHAKFLLAEHGSGNTLWLGSPNLTDRAWTRNAEAYAQVEVTDPTSTAARSLLSGIEYFAGSASEVSLASLTIGDDVSTDEERLDAARRQVAARLGIARQRVDANGTRIECEPAPHPDDEAIELLIARIGEPFVRWERGQTQVASARSANACDSELLRIALRWNEHSTEWLHAVPVEPALSEDRDDRALRQHLGARQTLAWIREVLSDVPGGDGGGPWDGPREPTRHRSAGTHGAYYELPSVESALRAWMRSPASLDEVDRILKLQSNAPPASDDPEERDAFDHLKRFAKTWAVLRKGLPRHPDHGR